MRIGIDLRSLQEDNIAGIAHYANQLTRALLKADQDNEYFLFFNSWRPIRIKDFGQATIVHNHWPSKLISLLYLLKIHPGIDKKYQLDLFWQPNIHFIKFSNHVKNIITIHDLSFIINKSWYSLSMRVWHNLQFVKNRLKSADHIIVVSENSKDDIKNLCNIREEKITVIKSGFDFQMVNPYSGNEKYFVYLGTIEPRKNLAGIIAALENIYEQHAEYRSIKLKIMGGQGWLNRNVFRKIKQSKYSANFEYLGYLPTKEKNQLISGSIALIWPSFYEGFSYPPLEALIAGKDVITSNAASVPEIVKGNAIMIDPYNIAELEQAILIKLRGYSNALGNEEREAWQEQYSWQRIATKYLEVFKQNI
ncbi:MAG: glycosyltransferase family 1 protein [Candidatus Komeilibacteria bacterium]